MKKIFLIIPFAILLAFSNVISGPCDVIFTKELLDFGKVQVGNSITESISLTVAQDAIATAKIVAVSIESIDFDNEAFKVETFDLNRRFDKNSFVNVIVTFQGKQNWSYQSLLNVKVDCGGSIYTVSIPVSADAEYQNSFYAQTKNLHSKDLLLKLREIISGHTVLTYRNARILMWSTLDNYDGWVEGTYSGRMVETNDIPNVNVVPFDTEHIWPRAYGSDAEPELSDLYHCVPTWRDANNRRANFPYDYVTGQVIWEDGGSKLGRGDNLGATSFEVRDVRKGNIARAMFYFATRYGNKFDFLTPQEKVLREWHYFNMPDDHETRRNNLIHEAQKNRNPFIDYPYIIERLPSISIEDAKFEYPCILNLSSDEVKFNFSGNDGQSFTLLVYAYQSGAENVANGLEIELQDIESRDLLVEYDTEYTSISQSMTSIRLTAQKPGLNGKVIVKNGDCGQKEISVSSFDDPTSAEVITISDLNMSFSPNPSSFGGVFTANFDKFVSSENLSLILTDISGRTIGDFSKLIQQNGNNISAELNFDSNIISGTYILTLQSEQFQNSIKVVIQK